MTHRRRRKDPAAILVRRVFEDFERTSASLLRVLPAEHPLACAKGCTHCCHQRVSVTPLEVFELADHLRRELDTAEFSGLVEVVRAHAARVRGLSPQQHRGHRCPLVQAEGSCAAYASRPLLCRGANSFDAAACARPGAAIPTYLQLTEAAQAAQERLDGESLRIAGREQMLELGCALAIVLDDPQAEARWRAGDPVFEAAAHSWFEAGELRHWSRIRNP